MNKDYETIVLALHFLDRWEADPFRWNIERIHHMIPSLRKILKLVKGRMEVGLVDESQYSTELSMAERVIDLANDIIKPIG
jgi:hypothetical protein